MTSSVKASIEKLVERKPDLQQILMASPFDEANSIDGLMTKELFMAELFHHDERFEDLEEELKRRLTSGIMTNRTTLVTGYNGVGKTTFLWHFIDNNPQFDHQYVNFHGADPAATDGDPIAEVLRDMVSGFDIGDQLQCIHRISSNAADLERVFGSSFLSCVRGLEGLALDRNEIADKLRHVSVLDTLLLYLMILFLKPFEKEKRIVYFDNLDSVGVDYLSREFRSNFENALYRAQRLALTKSVFPSENVFFGSSYRFVICLRDASSAIYNAHMDDSQGPTVTCMPYRVSLPARFYWGIMKKRLDFIKKVRGDDKEVSRVSSALLEFIGDKSFVEPALVGLFNSDYRKLAYALLTMANTMKFSDALTKKQKFYRFGMRGTLMRGVVSSLREHAYLSEHEETEYDPHRDEHGEFHHLRMILNTILNSSRGSIGEDTAHPSKILTDCSVYDLVMRLKGVYTYRDILKTVARCFLYHEKNWVQLLSIYGKPVRREDAFRDEEKLLKKLDELRGKQEFTFEENERKLEAEIVQHLDQIKLRISPAGVSYLRYLNTHFEYYSALEAPDSPPLFQIDPRQRVDRTGRDKTRRYQFEAVIDAACDRFQRHFDMMRKFYFRVFEGKLGYNPRTFRTSDFAFKFAGSRVATAAGMFHSSRVMYSHIDYIQMYRLHALSDPSLDDDAVRDINERLIPRIERYLRLLRTSYDDSTHPACDVFEEQIAKIRDSGFTDRSTRIVLPRTLMRFGTTDVERTSHTKNL